MRARSTRRANAMLAKLRDALGVRKVNSAPSM